jgi:hypothetical protein
MNIEKLNALAYAEGFIEDFIENYQTEDAKHIEVISTMWEVIAKGLLELRRENVDLEFKIVAARNALL